MDFIKGIKARSVFSFMIYATFCMAIYLNMAHAKVIPEILSNVVMAQLAFYYGGKVGKKQEINVSKN